MPEEKKETKVIQMSDHRPSELPVCYEVDWDKVKDIKDVIAVLKAFPMILFIHRHEYANNPAKNFLKECTDESTIEESDS